MKYSVTAAGLALLGATVPASAIPLSDRAPAQAQSVVHDIASWRYHNNCGWRGGRWVVDLGGGKLVICRPNRPGRDYVWRDEGPRHGWYNRNRKVWHFNNW